MLPGKAHAHETRAASLRKALDKVSSLLHFDPNISLKITILNSGDGAQVEQGQVAGVSLSTFATSIKVPEILIRDTSLSVESCRSHMCAPYEADPQLAYFARKGITHITASADSDLIVLGVHRSSYCPLIGLKIKETLLHLGLLGMLGF